LVMAVGAAWRSARLLMGGLGSADHPCASLWLVRGIRAGIIALAMGPSPEACCIIKDGC
jgi:hypothetical protein